MAEQSTDGTIRNATPLLLENLNRLLRLGTESQLKREQEELQNRIQAERDRGDASNDDRISLDGGRFEDDMTRVRKYDAGIWLPPQ